MIATKTPLGHQVIKDRSVQLTPRQRTGLVLIDGKRSLVELKLAMAASGVASDDLERLFALELVCDAEPQATASQAQAEASSIRLTENHNARTPQERYAQAYPLATQLTASLGLRGFRLNLAVEAVGSYEDLVQLAPRIREAVGPQRCVGLDNALNDR